jgi:large subunit ribosomal protein L21
MPSRVYDAPLPTGCPNPGLNPENLVDNGSPHAIITIKPQSSVGALICKVRARGAAAEARVYAIIETGGRQYRTEVGQTIQTEKLPYEKGETISLDTVLLVADKETKLIGAPVVAGASVRATVVDQFRGKKIRILKYKSGNRYRVRQGHRQFYTRLRIDEIITGSEKSREDSEGDF